MRNRLRPIRIIALSILMGFCIILYSIIDPAHSHFAPKCVFKVLTGYDCPSCGSQRALHALLNGRFYDAIMFNPFIFFVAPYLIAVIYASFSKSRIATAIKHKTHHHITISIYFVIYLAWWVVRNTEWWRGLLEH